VATAYACKAAGLKSIAIVRGERPAILSSTLQHCINYGMELKFISREDYNKKEEPDFIADLYKQYGNCTIVPEGGYHIDGAKGAALIWNLIPQNTYSHICTATGTATTLAGLLLGANREKIISIPVLKGMTDIEQRIIHCGASDKLSQLQIFDGYHFDGYAKKTQELLDFMNRFWQANHIPTDFVYTGKMIYAILDQIKNGCFPEGSSILCVHTGGLQGNLSLPEQTLLF
jgi:1-aminocyclopropane-1-carboxylate deaminase/D-cysteine desulfhydrase-like pyridoxal-dependent ACC family enzyme